MSTVPTGLSGLLVSDPYSAPNGSPDSVAVPTEVGGQQVDAVLELQSTTRGLLVPRMTTAQRNTMIVTDGFVIYNLDTNKFNFYSNGVWGSVGGGSVIGPGVSIAGDIAIFADNTGTVLADSGVPITQVPAPLTHLLRDSFLSTVNQIGNLGHIKFVNGVGLVFVDTLMPVQFIENNFGPGSQVCSLFTGELPGSSTTPSCLVELQSTTGAFVISRMTTAERLALFPTNGMIVYDTTANIFYAYQGGIWGPIDTSGGAVSQINQGTGITCSPNPIVGAGTISLTDTAVTAGSYTVMNGTVNAQGQLTAASSATVITDTTGTSYNLFIGIGSGVLGTTSIANCAVGGNTLNSNNQNFPSSSFNCAFGYTSLASNISGGSNSGFGYLSLGANTSGSNNCAFGDAAMRFNTSGSNNCAVGSLALASASAGSNSSSGSCAFGHQALFNNSAGGICAFGYQALYSNVTALGNSAFGYQALTANTNGANNNAFGPSSMLSNIGGSGNCAFGSSTLAANINGDNNSAVGYNSGVSKASYTNCSFFGSASDASVSGLTNSTAIGAGSSVATSNSLVLGSSCNVGINQSSPAYTLHVSNVSSICSIKLDNTSSTPSAPSAAQGGVIYISSDNLFYKNSVNTIQLNANYIHDDEANYNLFVGLSAGKLPTTTSVGCTAVGVSCLNSLTSGNDDCAYGEFSLSSVTSGSQNTGYGSYSLFLNTNGSNNTAIGYFSLGNMNSVSVNSNNTAVGYQSGNLRSGYSNCTFIGTLADASSTGLSNAAAIGANSSVSTSNSLILGNGCNVGIGMSSPTTRLCINGTDQNYAAGPHIQCQTSLDAYPQFQLLNFTHNNISLNFDSYWNGTNWISCINSGNFQIQKNTQLQFNYATGYAQGATITWLPGIILNTSGQVGIGDSSPGSKLSVVGNAQIGFASGTAGPTNGLIVSGNVGIGTSTANAPLQFANNIVNRVVALYQTSNNQHQFYGFGIGSSILRYQVDATTADHVFYAATSSSASNELVRIKGTGALQVSGAISTAPPASGATTVALGTAYQNTLGYDVLIVVYINVTAVAGGSIISGVGSTNTPTQQTVFSGVTGTPSVSAIVPNNYYLKISTSGTITAAIVGQQETPL